VSGTSAAPASRCVLFGGFPSAAVANDTDTWTWDGASWSHVDTTAPEVNTGTLVTFAGQPILFSTPSTSALGPMRLFRFDDPAWTEITPPGSPPSRTGAAVAAVDGGVVVFGGLSNDGTYSALADTWVWDGSTWTEKSTEVAPSGRFFAAAASLNGRAVVFGGASPQGALGDTWIWDGSTWAQASAASAPSPRVGARAATVGDQVVLFGGCAAGGVTECEFTGTQVGDTWIWDGNAWTDASPLTSPSARDEPALATLGATVVLFGGFVSAGDAAAAGDTWIWDGSKWSQRAAIGPTARGLAALGCW
jgi:hypothetical protein